MKLKLRTESTETLKKCLAQISSLRKFVILKISPESLQVISASESAYEHEPQIWCKFPMSLVFSEVEVQSNQNNWILLEINIEMFSQTLKNFDRANSSQLNIRLMKKEGGTDTRAAILSLYYSDVTANATTINHKFHIPVRIVRINEYSVQEPQLSRVDLMINLPKEFSASYRRLEKFRSSTTQDKVTIRAGKAQGGYLRFILSDSDNYTSTISWNHKLNVQKPPPGFVISDSLRASSFQDGSDEAAEAEITVKLKDWRATAKIVNTCETIFLSICHNQGCLIHCLLEDSDDVEVIYYISAVRNGELYSD